MRETTIAIRDDGGTLRKVTKIIQMRDGFAVSVPYHSAKEGWITEHPMHYEKLDVHTVMPSELVHFTASDRVKLSIHLDGFVQFSRGGEQQVRSGFDEATQTIKGVGLRAPTPVVVTSGPTFGIVLRGLEASRSYLRRNERKCLRKTIFGIIRAIHRRLQSATTSKASPSASSYFGMFARSTGKVSC